METTNWKNGSKLPAEKREQIIGMLCDDIKNDFYSVIFIYIIVLLIFLTVTPAASGAIPVIIAAAFFTVPTCLMLYQIHKELKRFKKLDMVFCTETVHFYSAAEGRGRSYREPFVVTSSGIRAYISKGDKYPEYKNGDLIYCIKFDKYKFRKYNIVCIHRDIGKY